MRRHPRVEIRDYEAEDAAATLDVFITAIMTTAAADYSPEQVAAWARPEQRAPEEWHRGMVARVSVVAVVGGSITGFSDVNAAGYVDMMFVSPRFARRGVARALMSRLVVRARESGASELSADVSITARPFFESEGFTVVAKQHPVTAGVVMTNFRMNKRLE